MQENARNFQTLSYYSKTLCPRRDCRLMFRYCRDMNHTEQYPLTKNQRNVKKRKYQVQVTVSQFLLFVMMRFITFFCSPDLVLRFKNKHLCL